MKKHRFMGPSKSVHGWVAVGAFAGGWLVCSVESQLSRWWMKAIVSLVAGSILSFFTRPKDDEL
jgi:hypothetical protein